MKKSTKIIQTTAIILFYVSKNVQYLSVWVDTVLSKQIFTKYTLFWPWQSKTCYHKAWFLSLIINFTKEKISFFFFSSDSLLLPTHLSPASCTPAQSCNPMDCSPPGSSVHGLFQARILEWVAISFSKWFLSWNFHKGTYINLTFN